MLSRRQFLIGGAGVVTAGAIALTVEEHPWTSPGHGATAISGDGILVMVGLFGGNDGLNTVIPYQDGVYLGGRRGLAHQGQDVLPIGDRLALHPRLAGLKSLWAQKRLAIVQGVGYPNPDLSHFRSMDIWQTGSAEHPVSTGWLGRWLDATGTDPTRTISVGATVPRALAGEKVTGGAVPIGPIRLPPAKSDLEAGFTSLAQPYAGEPQWPARVAQTGADFLRIKRMVGDVLAHERSTPGPDSSNLEGGSAADNADQGKKEKSAGELGPQLDLVAKLIRAGVPTRVYSVKLGGFDTHANERGTHDGLMGELDAGITRFFDAIKGDRRADKVVLMTYSEFGRRVAQNASGGTDHGTAAPLFVTGAAVKGGLYGEPPSLTKLDQGDLRFTTDFRSVYATMLEQVLGVEQSVSLERKFPTLDFV